MHKVLLLTSKKDDLSHWRVWLDSNFEVTQITNIDSLTPLLRSWRPHVVLYYDNEIRSEIISRVFNSTSKKIGLVIISPKYSLRHELVAFQNGADHFLIEKTPIESIKIRLLSLAKKIKQQNIGPQIEPTLGLPQNIKIHTFRNLKIYTEQNAVKFQDKFIKLTPTQTYLLIAFITHPNELLTRKWLKDHIFKNTKNQLRSIDAHISKLKSKLPMLNRDIISLYGQGYVLRVQNTQAA